MLVLLVVDDSESTAALIFCMLTIFVDEKRGDALVLPIFFGEGQRSRQKALPVNHPAAHLERKIPEPSSNDVQGLLLHPRKKAPRIVLEQI